VTELRGIAWGHTRAVGPLLVTAQTAADFDSGLRITWDLRSLWAFGEAHVGDLVDDYDLLVIDHPMIGYAARNGIFEPLDLHLSAEWLAEQARGSVGGSHESYAYDGHQWATAIDAACQVAVSRPDLLPEPPATFDEVLALARETGRVAVPLKPIDGLSCFLTLCANQGEEPLRGERVVSDELGLHVLEQLLELASVVAPECLSQNPIEILTAMSTGDGIVYCPYAFGYTNYAREGYAPKRVAFHDIPAAGDRGRAGSTLGGAGLAVSSRSANVEAAMAYVRLVSDPEVQRTTYVYAGGQPGHADAWDDEIANRITGDFFRSTRRTIDSSYVRPTHDGVAAFQSAAAVAVHRLLRGEGTPQSALAALNEACTLIDTPERPR
jgi:multiple sugar transport system substrate-binding protein